MFSMTSRRLPTTAELSAYVPSYWKTRLLSLLSTPLSPLYSFLFFLWRALPSTITIKFRKPIKLGAETASWLRHEGLDWEWTAATWRYFFWNDFLSCLVASALLFDWLADEFVFRVRTLVAVSTLVTVAVFMLSAWATGRPEGNAVFVRTAGKKARDPK
jgi:hypothetical protein